MKEIVGMVMCRLLPFVSPHAGEEGCPKTVIASFNMRIWLKVWKQR